MAKRDGKKASNPDHDIWRIDLGEYGHGVIDVRRILDNLAKDFEERQVHLDPEERTGMTGAMRGRIKRSLREILPLQIYLAMSEAGHMAAVMALLDIERSMNAKTVFGGPTELARDIIDLRFRIIRQLLEEEEAGRKRLGFGWSDKGNASFVREVERVLPMWRRARRIFLEHGREPSAVLGDATLQVMISELGPLPDDLVDDLMKRKPTMTASTPLAIACEHAARRLNLHAAPSKDFPTQTIRRYGRQTLRNKYQAARRYLSRVNPGTSSQIAPRRGRPKK